MSTPDNINASVTYDMAKKKWDITSPIALDHDGDKVYWNLSGVYAFAWDLPLNRVYIKFETAPTSLDPDRGPFRKISLDTTSGKELLIGELRKNGPGDFGGYTYNLWVELKGMNATRVFPIDPQIDNVAPPPPDGRVVEC